MTKLGNAAGVKFDFNVFIDRQPIDSQRLLLWAARFGKGEAFMSALSNRHFQQRESASKRSTLLAAAEEVGLEVSKVEDFLDSSELRDEVWRSYGEMTRKLITGIPLFCFSIPEAGLFSGPFLDANADANINGSGNKAQFLHLFEQLYKFAANALGDKLKRDAPLAPVDSMPPAQDEAASRLRAAGPKSFVGQNVRLVGLQAKPELNGAVGVCERFDKAQGRYAVRLHGHEKPLALKGGNLELLVEEVNKAEL